MCLVLCWGYRRWVREPHHKKLHCLPAFGFTCPVMSWRRFSQTQMETFLNVFRPWHHYIIQVLSLDLNRSSWRPSGHLHWTFPDGTFLYFVAKWFILIPKRAIGIASVPRSHMEQALEFCYDEFKSWLYHLPDLRTVTWWLWCQFLHHQKSGRNISYFIRGQ